MLRQGLSFPEISERNRVGPPMKLGGCSGALLRSGAGGDDSKFMSSLDKGVRTATGRLSIPVPRQGIPSPLNFSFLIYKTGVMM